LRVVSASGSRKSISFTTPTGCPATATEPPLRKPFAFGRKVTSS
jgi:hypothetical protein